jgi:uncharacterized protein
MPKGWNFIVELPPRRSEEAVVEKDWKMEIPGGLDFEGQHFDFPDGLSVEAQVRWMEESLLSVRLSLLASLKGECARCLAEAVLAISDDLMYLYYLRDLELGKDTELQSDDGFMPVEVDFWGRTLNFSDQVWESLLILLPHKLLCREDCAGLCPQCGADLNDGPCSCVSQEGDPRFEILRGLSIEEK